MSWTRPLSDRELEEEMHQIVNEDENSEDNIDDRDKIMFGWNDEEDEERRAASSEIHEDDREETSPGIYVKSSDEDFVVNLMIW